MSGSDKSSAIDQRISDAKSQHVDFSSVPINVLPEMSGSFQTLNIRSPDSRGINPQEIFQAINKIGETLNIVLREIDAVKETQKRILMKQDEMDITVNTLADTWQAGVTSIQTSVKSLTDAAQKHLDNKVEYHLSKHMPKQGTSVASKPITLSTKSGSITPSSRVETPDPEKSIVLDKLRILSTKKLDDERVQDAIHKYMCMLKNPPKTKPIKPLTKQVLEFIIHNIETNNSWGLINQVYTSGSIMKTGG